MLYSRTSVPSLPYARNSQWTETSFAFHGLAFSTGLCGFSSTREQRNRRPGMTTLSRLTFTCMYCTMSTYGSSTIPIARYVLDIG